MAAREALRHAPDPSAAPDTRAWIRDRLTAGPGAVAPQVADDAELLASEMVTQALRAGVGQVCVNLTHDGYAIRIDVTDGTGDWVAGPEDADAVERGLDVVHAVSAEWGWRESPSGRTGMWALLLLDGGP